MFTDIEGSTRLVQSLGDESAVVMSIAGFAAVARARGDDERAVRLAGAFMALRDKTGAELIDFETNQVEGLTDADLARLEGDLATGRDAGMQMTSAEAVAFALEG